MSTLDKLICKVNCLTFDNHAQSLTVDITGIDSAFIERENVLHLALSLARMLGFTLIVKG